MNDVPTERAQSISKKVSKASRRQELENNGQVKGKGIRYNHRAYFKLSKKSTECDYPLLTKESIVEITNTSPPDVVREDK